MGFLDYFGDAAKGAADSILADMERKAQEKHDMAMADKAIAREQAMTFMRGRQERKLNEQNLSAAAAEADARRKAERDKEDAKQKWELEKLTTEEAGRDRRASMRANAPKGESTAPKPPRMEFREVTKPDGRTEIHGFDPVTGELKTVNGRKVSDAKPTDPNAWLSQF